MKRGLPLFFFLLLVATAVQAATYALIPYGSKNIKVQGELNNPYLSDQEELEGRPSTVYRHDLRFQNVISGVTTPYDDTAQFNLQPLPGDPPDLSKADGYHLIPLDEAIVKEIATKANGNPDFVWAQVSNGYDPNLSAWDNFFTQTWQPHEKINRYIVDEEPYINIGGLVYLSGGGDYVTTKNPKAINTPSQFDPKTEILAWTTFYVTQKPFIETFSQNPDGSLAIKATTYSYWDVLLAAKVQVGTKPLQTLVVKETPVVNHSITYQANIPLSQINGLVPGKINKVKLFVNDAFGRSTSKELDVYVPPSCTPLLANSTTNANFVVKFPNKEVELSSYAKWTLEYNKDLCVVFDGMRGHKGSDPFQPNVAKSIPHSENYYMDLRLWSYKVKKSSRGILVINTSSEPSALVFTLYEGTTAIKRYSVPKGSQVEVILPVIDYNGRYTLGFPTPLVDNGYFSDANERVLDTYAAKSTFPESIKTQIEALIRAAHEGTQ